MNSETRNSFLHSLGWDDFFQTSFGEAEVREGIFPGRVIRQEKILYHVQIGTNEVIEAAVTGKLRRGAKEPSAFPAVGDWVVCSFGQGARQAEVHRVLRRKSLIQRKRAGREEAQLIAANVDFIFIATSLNEDFNLPRLGRYMALSRESGATPVVLLTKADLCPNPDEYIGQVRRELGEVEIFAISNADPASMDRLRPFLVSGKTSVLVGSSGVGKSTFTNYLFGSSVQKTQDLSGHARGRHTTTTRSLFITRWGGLVIDTPGMREVALFEEENARDFSDIEELDFAANSRTAAITPNPAAPSRPR